jgi:dehydration protein DpgD
MRYLAYIDYKKLDRVAYITLNRPYKLNALNFQMHDELASVWDDFEQDDRLWLAVITGAGDRAFSVGQDLTEVVDDTGSTLSPSSIGSRGRPGFPRLTERHKLTKPVIARVHGYTYGGGFELALACDIIVAATNAVFSLPEAKLGLIPGAGGVFRLTRQIPIKTAMGHLMTGRQMSAQRAYELGLVNEVVGIQDLDLCVDNWISDILRCAPLSVRAIKEIVRCSSHLSIEDAFVADYEIENLRKLSEDSREGPRAFLEKRDPRWKAR